ncbi:ribonuclease BN (tRNA processing enzyme) [Kribbella sp. VKM Ac-2571]|uniref:MBL fold metallo-hydrolase n=1 Tax=Kribbella sp. VKM Ac-2571 TaxID=2512222 RepID=UPI00105D92F8|nr:MBL fold metallo-hydrolase [Kribbella sp. VKM Ac-2571]TDO58252.1 ribonuclease BN (tRNA processing enzyme) [Kribbella sp. VKM Ac-2571]
MRRLTVLGSCGAWPEPGRACAGYLLEYDGFRGLLDLGYAALPRLLRYCPDGQVDAIFVTHCHPDHCVDVSGLARVRQDEVPDAPPIPLYAAPGVVDVLQAIEPQPHPGEVFDVQELGPAEVGPFRMTAIRLPHGVPNLGVRLEAPDLVVAYTGDSGPSENLSGLADGADLYIADATLQGVAPQRRSRSVMTATEAAMSAAGAKRLLLTHFWPRSDRSAAAGEAAAVFDGEIITADEDLVIDLA